MLSATLLTRLSCVACLLVLIPSPAAAAPLLINGNFETGDLGGWTTFVTSNGRTGPPAVKPFDVTGSGVTKAAQFLVGQLSFTPGVPAGGGIFQQFTTRAGTIQLSADIAAHNDWTQTNAAGGVFVMMLDGVIVDSFDFSTIAAGAIERATLDYLGIVSPGTHELRFLMTRPFLAGITTPYQYLDNINAQVVPEPGVLLLGLVGIAGFAGRKLHHRG